MVCSREAANHDSSVPEGLYGGSDSTELAEVLARSAWIGDTMGSVPELTLQSF
jgi:hypothetical protein